MKLRLIAGLTLTFVIILLLIINRNDGGRGELSKERFAKLDACLLAGALQQYLEEVKQVPQRFRDGFSGEIDRELINALSGASGELADRKIKLMDVPTYWKERVVTPWGNPYKWTLEWSPEVGIATRGTVTIEAGYGISCAKEISRKVEVNVGARGGALR